MDNLSRCLRDGPDTNQYYERKLIMKKMKKLLALLIAMVMVLSMGASVFAAPAADGSLEINNAIIGESYTLYKIFDLTYGDGGTSTDVTVPTEDAQNAIAGTYKPVAYTYTKGSGTDNFYTALAAATEYFTVTQVGTSDVYTVVRKMNGTTPVKTDAEVIQWMKDNVSKLPADRTIGTITAASTSVKWENLAYGYYYAESSAGSLVTIDSTLKDVIVKEKNTIPSDEKKVKDSGAQTEEWGTDDDAQIGDTVDFRLKVKDGKGTDSFITLHDKMSAGLTLKQNSFSITDKNGAVDPTNYTVYVDKDLVTDTTGTATVIVDKTVDLSTTDITNGQTTYHVKDDDSFVIVFKASYIASLAENDEITITYSAILNDGAVVGTPETNKSKTTYSNQTTTEKITRVHTYDVDILKYANDVTTTAIADAVFQLQDSTGNTRIWLTPGTAVQGYDVYEVAENQTPDLTGLTEVHDTRDPAILIGYKNDQNTMVLYNAFVTTAGKKVRINGLDVDKTYKLEEIEAPNGFNKLTEKVTVEATTDFADQNIQNLSGTELPSTGGIGTTIFYIIGAILVIGAGVVLVTRRRMNVQ